MLEISFSNLGNWEDNNECEEDSTIIAFNNAINLEDNVSMLDGNAPAQGTIITTFYDACKHGLHDVVEDFIEHLNGQLNQLVLVDVDAHTFETLLFTACDNGHARIVHTLLIHGAIPNLKIPDGRSCLLIAVIRGYDQIVQLLVEYGANIQDDSDVLLAAIVNRRFCALTLLFAEPSIIRGSPECISPMLLACELGDEVVVEFFLRYVDHINVNSILEGAKGRNCTALYAACSYSHHNLIDVLLLQGADPNIPDHVGNSCAHTAAMQNDGFTLVKILKHGGFIDTPNYEGVTPLYLACENGNNEAIDVLISNGANVNSQTNELISCLHVSAQYGFTVVLRKLLANGANVNVQMNGGPTPLFIAVQNGNLDCCMALLQAKADANIKTDNKQTPVMIAGYNGHTDISKLLMDHKAVINDDCMSGQEDFEDLLLENGADVRIVNKMLKSPMDVAVEPNPRVVSLLNTMVPQALFCKSCHKNLCSVVFLHCRHLASCGDCFLKCHAHTKVCPVCGDYYSETHMVNTVETL